MVGDWAVTSGNMRVWGIVLCLLPFSLQGQLTQAYQDTVIVQAGDTLAWPHAFILPYSERLQRPDQTDISPESYAWIYEAGKLIIRQTQRPTETWIVSYRYFLAPPADTLALRTFKQVRDTVSRVIMTDVILPEVSPDDGFFWPASEGLSKRGTITRGITVGNNGNLGINSGLNLQLEGDLGDGLTVVGAITDDNLPIQPDGSTQQITDLDQVFLKLAKGPYQLTIGDFEVSRRDSRFGNFYRNVQGLQLGYQTPQTAAFVSGAVAKGRFHTNAFIGIDGVSGPYRLTGQNGENLFIILAGSEKVYLNGKLMARGENQDYVINYNTAELTFTPKHVITNITRIVVDFEYSDRQFNRSLLTAQARHQSEDKRLSLSFSYARDADNPNAPFDNADAYFTVVDSLAQAGDAPDGAILSGIRVAGYDPERARYARKDTLVGDSVYVYYELSTDSSEAIFEVLFTNVGTAQGLYQRDPARPTVNAFVWVGPDEFGNPQGTHSPIRRWVLPKLLQVSDLKLSYQLTPHLSVYGEGAVSDWDQNRLSRIDDEDNQGIAFRTGIKGDSLALGDSARLHLDVYHQFITLSYQNLDRLYQAEYNRYWDLPEVNTREEEHITMGNLRVELPRQIELQTQLGLRQTGPGNQATRQVYTLSRRHTRGLTGQFSYTRIANQRDSLKRQSLWNRYEGDIAWKWRTFRIGTEIWNEDRVVQLAGELGEGTFRFVDLKPYLRTTPSSTLTLDLSYNYRRDREIYQQQLLDKGKASTWYAAIRYQPKRFFEWRQTLSWRQFDVQDSSFRKQGLTDSRTAAVNWQATLRPRKQWVFLNLVYDVSAEQIARQEVRFIPVNPGQGTHVWLDTLFNNDGIPDLPEFQLATNPLIADYLRIVIPSQQLFPSTRLGFNGLLRWNFQQVIPRDQTWWQEWIRQTRLATTFRVIQHKSRQNSLGSYVVDLTNPFADSSLISASYRVRQDIVFFQNAKRGEIGLFLTDNQTKSFLVTGDEFRRLGFWGARGRLNLGGNTQRNQAVELEFRQGLKLTESVAFDSRNFNISFVEITPSFVIQLRQNIRLTSGYGFITRQNTNLLGENDARARLHRLSLDGQFYLAGRNSLTANLEWTQVTQEGSPTPTATFELQEGLQPGGNAIWRLLASFFVLKNVELTVTYDGRASRDIPVLHTGRLEARAFF